MRALIALLILLAAPLAAQDRAGRDTPGEWVVTHHQPFGLWDSFCDERTTDDVTEERCYLRYVDVFSPPPKFAAIFVFITPQGGDFGLERGTRLVEGGFRAETAGEVTWSTTRRGCLRGGACNFADDEADALYAALSKGGELRLTFTDNHGQAQDLTWDLTPFAEALADYRANAATRGLLTSG